MKGVRELFNYNILPEHMQGAAQRYVEQGIPPGGFLEAVICNNLKEAIMRADDINADHLKDFVMFFYNETPGDCWGSREAMIKWIEARRGNELTPVPDGGESQ